MARPSVRQAHGKEPQQFLLLIGRQQVYCAFDFLDCAHDRTMTHAAPGRLSERKKLAPLSSRDCHRSRCDPTSLRVPAPLGDHHSTPNSGPASSMR